MWTTIKDKIIAPATKFILEDSSVKKFYFLPWLFSIIFLTVLLVYQSIYTYVELFWNKEQALVLILKFFHSDYIFEVAITVIVFILLYIFIIPIFEGWLINYIDKKNSKNEICCGDSISYWVYNFLPIFEYDNMSWNFKFMTVVNAYLFCIRFVWLDYIVLINTIFLLLFIISTIVNILFAYAKYIIILENKKLITSIWLSSKIAIINILTTIKLYFFMFILNVRVVINFLVFLIFPLLIIFVVSFITSKIFMLITVILLSIIFLLLILFLGYLNWVLEVFKTTIWYFAYIEWKKKLDIIKEENKWVSY